MGKKQQVFGELDSEVNFIDNTIAVGIRAGSFAPVPFLHAACKECRCAETYGEISGLQVQNQAVATCQKKVAGVSRQTAYVLHDVTHLRDTFA